MVDGIFQIEPVGQLELKGFHAPVKAWRVLGERAAASRFEASHAQVLGRFIGRDSEVLLLLERWAMASEGEGQVVLLTGEAGIGKSRISQALRERLKSEPSMTLLWQCSPYFANSALYSVVQQLERAAGIVAADLPNARSSKLEQALAATGLESEGLGYLLKLLGLPDEGRVPAGQTPQQEKAKTLKALIEGVLGLAEIQPVLLLVEDAHWIDPTTEELLTLAVERLRQARVLILITCRPEYSPSWGNPTNLTRLALSRLGQRHCVALIGSVTGGKPLPEEVVAEIVRKTDGIPLFVEELTKTVIESGLLRKTDTGYELKGPLPALAIPSTLQDSLMARLDRLAPAKDVAQVGATIGREFTHRLLATVLRMNEGKLNEAIDDLVRSELLFRRGVAPDATYTFKHALVRDTAYNSMVKGQRALRHGQIAAAIQHNEPDTTVAQPELLAHHYEEAGEVATAFRYWSAAGDHAAKRTAFREAVKHYQAARSLFPRLETVAQTPEIELDLQMKLGSVLMNSVGYRPPETRQCFARALELSSGLGDVDGYVAACAGFAPTLFAAGRFNDVLELFGNVRAVDLEAARPAARVNYLTFLGIARFHLGRFDEAWGDLLSAKQLAESVPILRNQTIGGTPSAIPMRGYAARVRAYSGYPDFWFLKVAAASSNQRLRIPAKLTSDSDQRWVVGFIASAPPAIGW